jgi:hypothetical protein
MAENSVGDLGDPTSHEAVEIEGDSAVWHSFISELSSHNKGLSSSEKEQRTGEGFRVGWCWVRKVSNSRGPCWITSRWQRTRQRVRHARIEIEYRGGESKEVLNKNRFESHPPLV